MDRVARPVPGAAGQPEGGDGARWRGSLRLDRLAGGAGEGRRIAGGALLRPAHGGQGAAPPDPVGAGDAAARAPAVHGPRRRRHARVRAGRRAEGQGRFGRAQDRNAAGTGRAAGAGTPARARRTGAGRAGAGGPERALAGHGVAAAREETMTERSTRGAVALAVLALVGPLAGAGLAAQDSTRVGRDTTVVAQDSARGGRDSTTAGRDTTGLVRDTTSVTRETIPSPGDATAVPGDSTAAPAPPDPAGAAHAE